MCFTCSTCHKFFCSWQETRTKKEQKKHARGKTRQEHIRETQGFSGICEGCFNGFSSDEE